MTQLKIQIPADLPEATVEDRVRHFFLNNGYYELESKDLLWFKNYPENRIEQSPVSIQHELKLTVSGDQIQVGYDANSKYEKWELRYVELLLQELQQAVSSGDVKMVDLAQLEKKAEASLFRPAPQWAKVMRWVVFIAGFILIATGSKGVFFNWKFGVAIAMILSYNLFYYLSYRQPRTGLSEG